MSQRKTIFERFHEFPRAIQWAIYAAIGTVVFLIWVDHIAPLSEQFKFQADELASDLRVVRDTQSLDLEIMQLRETIEGIGPVSTPRPMAEGEIALTRAVNDVLEDFSISNDSFSMRVRGTLPRTALQGLIGGRQVQVLSGDLRFNASPDDAIAIIAALEARPEIESLNTLNLTRLAGRRVNVQLTMESWVLGEPTRGGRL